MTKEEIEEAVRQAERVKGWLHFDGERATLILLARALLHLHTLTTAPLPEELAEIEELYAEATGRDGDRDGREMALATVPRLLAGMRAQAATIRERDAEIVALKAERKIHATAIKVEMEKACRERDAAETAQTESRYEGRRAGLAFALDLLRAGGAP